MPEEIESPLVLGQFIPLHYHHNMLLDPVRMAGFKEAIDAVVPPGGKVLELGGGTGVLSFFAAQRAGKVWCVEHNPELAREARRLLSLNRGGDRVEVIEADALDYLPPEPVDVVVCEMLHVALVREKQIEVIASFKDRYRQRFGPQVPLFVPESSILALQPVQQSFDFHGYYAPVPVFQQPGNLEERTRELALPAVYRTIDYAAELPASLAWEGTFAIAADATLNAFRFTTKNLLAILVREQRTIDWFNQYLVLPLPTAVPVHSGDSVAVQFCYQPGASLNALADAIQFQVMGG